MSILQNSDSTIETTDESNSVDVNKEEIPGEKILEHSTSSNAKQKLLDLSHVGLIKKYIDDEINIVKVDLEINKQQVPREVINAFSRILKRTDSQHREDKSIKDLLGRKEKENNDRKLVWKYLKLNPNHFFSDSTIITNLDRRRYLFATIYGNEYCLNIPTITNVDEEKKQKIIKLIDDYYFEMDVSIEKDYYIIPVAIEDNFDINESYVCKSSFWADRRNDQYYDYTNLKDRYALLKFNFSYNFVSKPTNSSEAKWTFLIASLNTDGEDTKLSSEEILKQKIKRRKEKYEKDIMDILNQ